MDYEKAYKNALQLAKSYYDKGTNEFLDTIFPELAESEDEKIRKEIISAIQSGQVYDTDLIAADHIFELDKEVAVKWIAYIEKQKEQKSTVIIPKFRVGDFVKDTNYHGNPVYEIMHIDKECYVCQYRGDKSMGDKSVMHFALDNPYLRLVQNPAEWSEEDEKQIRQIERIVKNGATPKLQEKIHNFLYSLRPQPHWKPSNEQMKALKYVAYHLMPDENYREEMFSLYEQLKNL